MPDGRQRASVTSAASVATDATRAFVRAVDLGNELTRQAWPSASTCQPPARDGFPSLARSTSERGSGTDIALAAPYFLGDDLLDRFDIVGVDPRGVAASDNIRCFPSVEEQTRAYAGLNVAFPWTKAEEKAYVASSKVVGKACSTTGEPLTGAASTAEVARDMDVLRRAVGDKKLSYLGFSYGTALGQHYANMFPDRFRALVVDGVLNPNAWVGQGKARNQLQETRLRSADGAYRALHEILVRCGKVGPAKCELAAKGNPVAAYETVAKRLRKKPVVIDDPDYGSYTVSYADFVGATLGALYDPYGWSSVVEITVQLLAATDPAAGKAATAAARKALAAVCFQDLPGARRPAPGARSRQGAWSARASGQVDQVCRLGQLVAEESARTGHRRRPQQLRRGAGGQPARQLPPGPLVRRRPPHDLRQVTGGRLARQLGEVRQVGAGVQLQRGHRVQHLLRRTCRRPRRQRPPPPGAEEVLDRVPLGRCPARPLRADPAGAVRRPPPVGQLAGGVGGQQSRHQVWQFAPVAPGARVAEVASELVRGQRAQRRTSKPVDLRRVHAVLARRHVGRHRVTGEDGVQPLALPAPPHPSTPRQCDTHGVPLGAENGGQ
ncbi:alpha/beta fold hydrolase [Micromonospora sp. WMMD980]|uniref:alpha/beta fold hydrolase n=1 Tax=Micromonospora sp. WMMD980 TaxID=3016088 RepID=UPI0024160750|nr:alpha/beta fold hydrolase [Micromonospora sp. WMMD980]MDG4804244.1 alpha/beta fold hydrolase [Micromonospora sp. WMMD980]